MIEAHGVRFLLTGSSARKLRRTHTALMAGRAKVMRLLPFVSAELKDWHLATVLLYGTIPGICLTSEPRDELQSYVGDYLREEIQAEALARRVEGFSRFLQRAAQSNTEIINFEQVARDALVPSRTIRAYYQILEDTLVGVMLECFAAPGKRQAISRGKFYFFDSGVVHALTNTWSLPAGSSLFGRAFEQFIFQELYAYCCMQGQPKALQFWRSTTQHEVDFVCAGNIGIEVKATQAVHAFDLKGLQALHQQSPLAQRILVSQDPFARRLDGVSLMPYRDFLQALWQNDFKL